MSRHSRVLNLLIALLAFGIANAQTPPVTAIKAGRLIDPDTGTASANQVILIEGEKIKTVGWLPGPTVIPSGPMIGNTGEQFWPTPEMYEALDFVARGKVKVITERIRLTTSRRLTTAWKKERCGSGR